MDELKIETYDQYDMIWQSLFNHFPREKTGNDKLDWQIHQIGKDLLLIEPSKISVKDFESEKSRYIPKLLELRLQTLEISDALN